MPWSRPPAAVGWPLLVAAGMLAACGGSPAPAAPTPQPPGEPVTGQKCGDGDTYVVGPYTYANNQWGKSKVPAGQTFQQCLQARAVSGRTEYGWTFRWPGHDPSVYAYPEIMFGWTPWGGGPSSDARFPMPVEGMPAVTVRYDLESAVTGYYNLAGEVWLTRTGVSGVEFGNECAGGTGTVWVRTYEVRIGG